MNLDGTPIGEPFSTQLPEFFVLYRFSNKNIERTGALQRCKFVQCFARISLLLDVCIIVFRGEAF